MHLRRRCGDAKGTCPTRRVHGPAGGRGVYPHGPPRDFLCADSFIPTMPSDTHDRTYIDGRLGDVQVEGVQVHVPFLVHARPLGDFRYGGHGGGRHGLSDGRGGCGGGDVCKGHGQQPRAGSPVGVREGCMCEDGVWGGSWGGSWACVWGPEPSRGHLQIRKWIASPRWPPWPPRGPRKSARQARGTWGRARVGRGMTRWARDARGAPFHTTCVPSQERRRGRQQRLSPRSPPALASAFNRKATWAILVHVK